MRHMHFLVFIYDLYFFILIFCRYPFIQFFDNRHKLGHYLFQIFQRPFFQRFRKYGMIGVGACLAYYFDGFVHRKRLIIYKDANQLRYHHRRMGIVDLDYGMLIHFAEIIFLLFHFLQNQLSGIAHHKILLVDTKQIARFVRIIRI